MDTLNEKTVIITGASGGLGEATARHLASRGARVVLGARRQEQLDTIVADIKAEGGEALAVVTDVTQREQVQALVQAAVDAYGRLDAIINNAGLMANSPLDDLRVDEWDAMIDINIKGVLYGIAAALPVFRAQKAGHFVNISSVAGIKVFAPGGTVYSGTKFAVSAISEGLRVEAGGNIRTTTILPGAAESDLRLGTTQEDARAMIDQLYGIAIPAEAIARAVAFALEQPADVDVNEIVVRPTVQDF